MTGTTLADTVARARAFCDDDPDEQTRAELQRLLARVAAAEPGADALLIEAFGGPLEFGTAGLRGILGPGESRMNERVVAQTTAGLCAALAAASHGAHARGICIGCDGRRKSRDFADVATRIAAGAGFVVHRFERVVSTPLLAYSVTLHGAAAGVMITASHNPPEYNGYKVYWDNGAQIIPPRDREIAAAIAAVRSVKGLALGALHGPLVRPQTGVEERYLAKVAELVGAEPAPSRLRIAYTALHGVGERFARAALLHAGFPELQSVAEQAEPDGEFPTVAFPNPEEPGAMDLVLALAERTQADLVLANDPDADRLCVGARRPDGSIGLLTGNETGLLLAEHLLSRAPADGKNLVLASLVSTPLVARLCAAHGARCELTLTGFKWIANRAIELERGAGLRTVLGFEEALGFSVGSLVRDKDGTSAAVLAARIAAQHAAAGRTLFDALEALYRRHGLYESRPVSLTLRGHDGMAKMAAVMADLRAAPPGSVAGHPVRRVVDHERGQAGLPPSNVLLFHLGGEHRICIRPSGTEPKLKLYFDAFAEIAPGEPLAAARARARAEVDACARDFLGIAHLDD